jgi:hypothetical protein
VRWKTDDSCLARRVCEPRTRPNLRVLEIRMRLVLAGESFIDMLDDCVAVPRGGCIRVTTLSLQTVDDIAYILCMVRY